MKERSAWPAPVLRRACRLRPPSLDLAGRAGPRCRACADAKRRACAAAGIREFWLLNLEADVLEIYRQPEGHAYHEQLIIPAGGTATPLAFPDVTIALADILPPR